MQYTIKRKVLAVLMAVAVTLAYMPVALWAVTGEALAAPGDEVTIATFESNGGTPVESVSATKATTFTKPADPTKDGYDFAGWYSDIELTKIYEWNLKAEKNITLYAKWQKYDCTVNFYSQKDNGYDYLYQTKYVEYDTAIGKVKAPSKYGYVFVGWKAVDNDDSAIVNVSDYVVKTDKAVATSFEAVFKPIKAEWTYSNATSSRLEASTSDERFAAYTNSIELFAEDAVYTGKAYDKAKIEVSPYWNTAFGLLDTKDLDIRYTDALNNPINGTPVDAGTYKAYVLVGGYYLSKTFVIKQDVPEYEAPKGIDNLRFKHESQKLAVAGKTDIEGLYFVYTLKVGEVSTDIPKAQKVGTYKVYWELKAKDGSDAAKNYNLTNEHGSFEVEIYPEGTKHIFNYLAHGNEIRAICADEDCDEFPNAFVKVRANDMDYTGEAYNLAKLSFGNDWTIENKQPEITEEDINYYSDEDVDITSGATAFTGAKALTAAPKKAGKYYAVITCKGETAYDEFNINKAEIKKADFEAPTAKEGLVFTNEDQELINAGSTSNGKLMYYVKQEKSAPASFDVDGVTGWTSDATDITGLDAGIYYVYYGVCGDANHESYYDGDYVKVIISKKTVEIVWSNLEFVYDGKAHKPTASIAISSLAEKDNRAHEIADISVSVRSDILNSPWDSGTESQVGNYVAKITGATLKSGLFVPATDLAKNYNIDLDQLRTEWTIVKRPITVKAKDTVKKTYGDAANDPYWAYGAAEAGFRANLYDIVEDVKDELKMNPNQIKNEINGYVEMDREAGEDVGTYEMTICESNRAEIKNYDITYEAGTFEITKRDILVIADDNQGKIYGEADPEVLTYTTEGPTENNDGRREAATVSGFVDKTFTRGADKTQLTITDSVDNSFTGELVRVAGENAGSYQINQGTLDSKNYNIIYEASDFVIDKRPVYANQITWGTKSFKYDGYKHIRTAKVTKTGDASGLATRDKAFGITVNSAKTKVGTYTVTATIDKKNYYLAETCKNKMYIVKNLVLLKATPYGKDKVKLTWNKATGANYYKVYGTRCNDSFKYVTKTWKNSIIIKKVKGQNLNIYDAYKFYVVAYNKNHKKIAQSYTAHVITNNINQCYSNVTSIEADAANKDMKVGQTTWIGATIETYWDMPCLTKIHTSKFRYRTSDSSVAKVDSKGTITAVGEGTCYIYVLAVNGLWDRIQVKVTE